MDIGTAYQLSNRSRVVHGKLCHLKTPDFTTIIIKKDSRLLRDVFETNVLSCYDVLAVVY